MEEYLFIKNRFGEKLEALLRKPKADGKLQAVLFVSGFGMDLREYINSNDEISKRLVEKGFLTLQFSFAGRGKSEGDYRQMTLERQGEQIEDMIGWLVKRFDVDKARIGIHATSFGAPSTLCADLSKIASICFVAGTYYPGRSLRQVFMEERNVKVEYGKDVNLPRSDGSVTAVGPQFFSNIDSFNIEKSITKMHKPIFLIHGDKDTKVKTEEVENVFGLIKSNNKKLRVFKNGDHGITDVPRSMREEFLRDVADWFQKTL